MSLAPSRQASSLSHISFIIPLKWRHNERNGFSNHWHIYCLINHLFSRTSKKTSKLRATGFCEGIHRWPVNSPQKQPVTRIYFSFDDVIMPSELIVFGAAIFPKTCWSHQIMSFDDEKLSKSSAAKKIKPSWKYISFEVKSITRFVQSYVFVGWCMSIVLQYFRVSWPYRDNVWLGQRQWSNAAKYG